MPSEAELWGVQRATVESALDFAISFLGCRMGPRNDKLLDAAARGRLLDICRAVSIVESRHGTIGPSQPKRDPLQCGNPADSWWRELTGQAGQGSRFICGPGHDNYWADEIADAASTASGFNPAASLALLADIKKGHGNSTFTPTHSYVWGILYLIHRINTAVDGGRSFACGDVGRERLIIGAVSYNAGGVPDYEDRLRAALREFGGLVSLDGGEVDIDNDLHEGDDPPPPSEQPHDSEPSGGISRGVALVAILAGIIAVPLIGWHIYGAIDYADDFTKVAPQLLTNLTVLSLVMERALAVLNTAWLGEETERRRARYAVARQVFASGPGENRAIGELKASSIALAETESKRARLRVVVGFLFGLAISGAGIRTLAALTKPLADGTPAGQVALFHSVDIILTAALLAGGSAGMAKLAELVRALIEGTGERLRERAARRS